mgnify:CR=1 FL=1
MQIGEFILNDVEIQELKKEFKILFKKPAPPYNYDEFDGIEDYKKKIKIMIDSGKTPTK